MTPVVDTANVIAPKDLMGYIEHEIAGGQVIRPDFGDISCGQFTIGDHQSEIAPAPVHNLLLSTDSNGTLRGNISGQKEVAKVRSGVLTYVTPGLAQEYAFDGKTTNTILGIDDALFKRAIDLDPSLPGTGVLEPRLTWTRPALNALVEEQYSAMRTGAAGSKVLTESIALRIAYELLTTFGAPARPGAPVPLTEVEIAKLASFIEDKMEDDFDLSALARQLDRDPFAFTRSFKAATGLTPHQYVIQRRLMRVKDLLLNTNDTLADITYATGFSNQPHMTSTFSKHLGTSPGKWRKAQRT